MAYHNGRKLPAAHRIHSCSFTRVEQRLDKHESAIFSLRCQGRSPTQMPGIIAPKGINGWQHY